MEQELILSNIQLVSVICVTSVAAAVLNLKKIINHKSPGSFQSIIIGLILIDSVVVCEILKVNNVFDTVPFINNPVFFDITYSIGIITGIALLVKGVSTWMPVFNTFKKLSTTTINKLNLFKKIDQLLLVEHRYEVLLASASELIAQQYLYLSHSAYLYSQRDKKFIRLQNTDTESNSDGIKTQDTIRSRFLEINVSSEIQIVEYIQNAIPMAKVVVPIMLKKTVIGVWIFTTDDKFEKEDISNIKILADIFASKADHLNLQQRNMFSADLKLLQDNIEQTVDLNSELQENLITIAVLLKRKISFDIFSVTFLDGNRSTTYSISGNNRILTAKNQKSSDKNEIENYIISTGLDILINDLENEVNFIVNPLLLRSNMKSFCAIPVFENNKVIAIVTVSADNRNNFTSHTAAYLKAVKNIISALRNNEQQQADSRFKKGIYRNIMQFNRLAFNMQDNKNLSDAAAEFIYSLCQAEFVRISDVDSNNRFLNSISLMTTNHHKAIPSADAPLLLSLLPLHMDSIKKQRRQIVDSAEITEIEKNHIYGSDIDSLLIFPVILHNKTKMICTIGLNCQINEAGNTRVKVEAVEQLIELLAGQFIRINAVQRQDENISSRLKSRIDRKKGLPYQPEYKQYNAEQEYQKIGL